MAFSLPSVERLLSEFGLQTEGNRGDWRQLSATGTSRKMVYSTDQEALSDDTIRHLKLDTILWYMQRIGIFTFVSMVFMSACTTNDIVLEWHWMFWFGALFILPTEISHTPQQFFQGRGINLRQQITKHLAAGSKLRLFIQPSSEYEGDNAQVGFWTLMPSVFITWIFAKSIYNSATLAYKFGVVGSFAYTGWYFSFFSVSLVGYRLRTMPHKFQSFASAIDYCYGPIALFGWSLASLYRLFNEVWSNSIVIGSFYGSYGSPPWWAAVVISTMIPCTYVVMGGMRSSLISDVVQAYLAIVLLMIVLGVIGRIFAFEDWWTTGTQWSLEGGLDIWLTALVQGIFSYPFFDPVLYNRVFLGTPKTMLLSFFVGGTLAALFILFFGFLGVYGIYAEVGSGVPAVVMKYVGSAIYQATLVIMVASSISTQDSTFVSTGQTLALEIVPVIAKPIRTGKFGSHFFGRPLGLTSDKLTTKEIFTARVSAVIMAVAGTLLLISQQEAIDATTVSGTMVMGLGPPVYLMLIWRPKWHSSPTAFLFSFILGVALGIAFQVKTCKDWGDNEECTKWTSSLDIPSINFGSGSYKTLLGTNVIGHLACLGACLLGFLLDQYVFRWPVSDMPSNKEETEPSSEPGKAPYHESPRPSPPVPPSQATPTHPLQDYHVSPLSSLAHSQYPGAFPAFPSTGLLFSNPGPEPHTVMFPQRMGVPYHIPARQPFVQQGEL